MTSVSSTSRHNQMVRNEKKKQTLKTFKIQTIYLTQVSIYKENIK